MRKLRRQLRTKWERILRYERRRHSWCSPMKKTKRPSQGGPLNWWDEFCHCPPLWSQLRKILAQLRTTKWGVELATVSALWDASQWPRTASFQKVCHLLSCLRRKSGLLQPAISLRFFRFCQNQTCITKSEMKQLGIFVNKEKIWKDDSNFYENCNKRTKSRSKTRNKVHLLCQRVRKKSHDDWCRERAGQKRSCQYVNPASVGGKIVVLRRIRIGFDFRTIIYSAGGSQLVQREAFITRSRGLALS